MRAAQPLRLRRFFAGASAGRFSSGSATGGPRYLVTSTPATDTLNMELISSKSLSRSSASGSCASASTFASVGSGFVIEAPADRQIVRAHRLAFACAARSCSARSSSSVAMTANKRARKARSAAAAAFSFEVLSMDRTLLATH